MSIELWRLKKIGDCEWAFLPLSDAIDHEDGGDCICGPTRVDSEGGQFAWRHVALQMGTGDE